METKNFEIESTQSQIHWIGRKVTGAHNGTIAIKEGTLILNNNKPTGGKFVIDTTSIKILDVTDPDTNAQFAGHLASDDFFSSEKFPSAVFEIASVIPKANDVYHLDGNLTIKNITHTIGFDAEINTNGNTVNASGKMMVDRTKYGIKFRSGNFFKDLGDTLIYNDFELNVEILAKAAIV
jgi:polyisoprenoid-binding protein YceI